MKKALVLVGILSGTLAAHAGYKGFYPVDIDVFADFSGRVMGSLGDARASSSPYDAIHCWQVATFGSRVAYCNAFSEKYAVGCWMTDAALVATVGTLQGDSYLNFEWDKTGGCTRIEVNTSSHFRPKTL